MPGGAIPGAEPRRRGTQTRLARRVAVESARPGLQTTLAQPPRRATSSDYGLPAPLDVNSGTLRQPVVLPTRIRLPVVGFWRIPQPRSLRGQPLARLQADAATTANEYPARRAIGVRIENQVG